MAIRRALFVLTLAMLALAACAPAQATPSAIPVEAAAIPVVIHFGVRAGDAPVGCSVPAQGLGLSANSVQFNDLRFYVSNVALVTAAGEVTPANLYQDGKWQSGVTALLDFEDGTAGCVDAGNAEFNNAILASVPAGDYAGIQFDLGLPAAANHQDVTVAPSPLNLPAMWWNWQGGYKFVRIDMKVAGQEASPTGGAYFIHLGSTGCASANEATAPTTACTRPNLATIRLDNFDAEHNMIVADVATLLAGIDLSHSTPMPPGCMAGADDPDCIALLPAFGLDVATGQCAKEGCASQTFFRVAPAQQQAP